MPVELVSVSNVSQLLFVNLSSADSINFLRDQMRALSVVLFLRTLVALSQNLSPAMTSSSFCLQLVV